MKPMALTLLFLLCASACSANEPETVTIRETVISEVPVTVEVTQQVTIEVERTVEVTREVEVTRVVERPATVTPTSTPVNTPTPSSTPTITSTPTDTPIPTDTPTPTPSFTPTPTPDLAATATVEAFGDLTAPKGNGFYTVGDEILPGKWHSTGTGNGCYWERLDANQELLANHFGVAGGTVYVREDDHEIYFEDCGTWEYVEGVEPILQANAAEPKNDGFYTVGIEIAPGRWVSQGSGDGCYWERLDQSQNIIDNHFGAAGGTVTLNATDYEVHFEDCGIWEYVQP